MMSDYLKVRIGVLAILLLFMSSCRNRSEIKPDDIKPDKEEMTHLNRYIVQKDRERIQNYIERKNLKMNESPTGLWYQILKTGEGVGFAENSKVSFEYECSLLDGTKCYSSENLGIKEVVLGRSNMESGLDEGLRMLKPGAEAIFIIPPYLAYGLLGDGKKIPSRSVIVYNIKTLE